MCTLRMFTDGKFKDFTCQEVKLLEGKWKHDFRVKNGSDRIVRDKLYEEYCREIDEFIARCPHKINLKCDKCPPEDHEGNFCRCEVRNILLAKQIRKSS